MSNQKLLHGSFTLINLGYQLKGREKYYIGKYNNISKILRKKDAEKKRIAQSYKKLNKSKVWLIFEIV